MGKKPKRRRATDSESGQGFGPQSKKFLLIAGIVTIVLLILIYSLFSA